MNEISTQLTEHMKEAMRNKDKARLIVIRALKTALTNAAIKKDGLGTELEHAEEIAVVRSLIKQRQDSVEQFTEAGRQELAANEAAEIEILSQYLPAQLSQQQLQDIIDQAVTELGADSKAQMGAVMKLVQERVAGRAEGKTIAQLVGKKLS